MAGDGQVTLGNQIVKASARKVRRIADDRVLAGIAGGTADALALLERFEKRLQECGGNLLRAAVSLVSEWRTDKALRRLEAMMLVADLGSTLLLSGNGDVMEPEGEAASIGSGSGFALSAARAYLDATDWPAEEVARRAMERAAEICIYTNDRILVEVLGA
jgi:ATP-dependent HslUV protease subunit HslV